MSVCTFTSTEDPTHVKLEITIGFVGCLYSFYVNIYYLIQTNHSAVRGFQL